MIRVLLVDDHRLVRTGLRRVLDDQADFEVVGECDSGEAAIERARDLIPDVVLMDINMPGIGGLEATRRILQRNTEVKIVAVSMHVEEPFPSRILAAGAHGYVSKDSAPEEVIAAIRKVHRGGHYVASTIAGNLAASFVKGSPSSPFESLSQREMQVMLMLTQGHSTQQISDKLCLSPKTVSTYRYRLFDKLDVSNNVELTRMALRYGLIEDHAEQ